MSTPGIRWRDQLGQLHLAGVGAPKLVPSAAASLTASSTAGCAWPRIIGPHEQT